MSVLRFEGTPVDDDLADRHYLALTHDLIKKGELTPSQEAQGGLTVITHGETFVTSPMPGSQPAKMVPVLYLAHSAIERKM